MIELSGRALSGLMVLGLLALFACLAPRSDAAVPVPDLSWAPCPEQSGFDCATAEVPRDYRKPNGATIELAVIRHAAAGPDRIGSLFLNPGGPGPAKTVLPEIFDALPEAVQERFDVTTWDPRGFGESTSVQCFSSLAEEQSFLEGVGQAGDTFPVGAAEMTQWIERYASFGRNCAERAGGLLRHVSTAESARDLDLLRRAVGSSDMNYFGNSYGTFLGATYANLFPRRVRTMVLGSVTNPVAWFDHSSGGPGDPFLPTFLRQRSDVGSRKTLNGFLDLCGRTSEAQCAFTTGDPDSTSAKFDELLARVGQAPAGTEPSYADLVSTVAAGLYNPRTYSDLAEMLQSVWEGGPVPASRSSSAANYASFGGFLGVVCGESPNPKPTAFPGIDGFSFARSGPIAGGWTWLGEPCSTWPATAAVRYTGPWDRRTANPVLVIGNTHDPATPYQNAVKVSELLARARLFTVDGYGHGAFGQPCTFDYLRSYFIDLELPPSGARCDGIQPFS